MNNNTVNSFINTSSFILILAASVVGVISTTGVQRLIRRQAQSCLDYVEFSCATVGCISRYDVCDGTKDCSDGSDETAAACRQLSITTCPPNSQLFQCTYGACISLALRCDGNEDCSDASDETDCAADLQPLQQQQPLSVKPSTSIGCSFIGSDKFARCDNGQCIDQYSQCDGVVDCQDKSDETKAICFRLFKGRCPGDYWQCAYGACLEQTVRCDSRLDCWDGSDEAGCPNSSTTPPPLPTVSIQPGQSTGVSRPVTNGKPCVVPLPADNRRFAVYKCRFTSCTLGPGQSVADQTYIVAACDSGYQLGQYVTQFISSCNNGIWFPDIPQCDKLCPKLHSDTLDLLCWRGSEEGCDKPMFPGTRIQFRCREFHQTISNQNNEIRCEKSGEWSAPLPHCIPNCGVNHVGTKVEPTILGGEVSKAGQFPWHAGLFHFKGGRWEAVCGGTLVTTNLVLTAAHCVTKKSNFIPPIMKKEEIMVVLGKYYREWDKRENSEARVGVKEVHVHKHYHGSSQHHSQDIAILELERSVQVNSFVIPACIDFTLRFVEQVFSDKSIQGYVAGWGNTEDCTSQGNICNSTSPVLKYTRVNVMSNTECYQATQRFRPGFISLLTSDKFCAGNGNVSQVQQGDSGGGLTFLVDGAHYVYGIVSTKIQLEQYNKRYYSFSAFTSIPEHMMWLKDKMFP